MSRKKFDTNAAAHQLRELRRRREEIERQIEAVETAIKSEMDARRTDELAGDDWRITWRAVESARIDTAALKKAMPDIAAAFTKTASTRRFCLI